MLIKKKIQIEIITYPFLSKPDLQAIVFMKHGWVFLVLAILGIRRKQHMRIYFKAIGLNTGDQTIVWVMHDT